MKKLSSLFVVLAALALPQAAFAEGDYDGDGKSDFVVATVNRRANQTTFFVQTAANRRIDFILQASGDALVPGDFDGDGKTQAAVVNVREMGDLAWHTIEADGSESVVSFGLNGDRPIVGDFDCDGKDDRAVTRQSGSALRWYISLSTGGMEELNYGLKNDTAWAADIDGNNCDDLIVSRLKNGAQSWFYKQYWIRNATEVQWGGPRDGLLRPMDVNGDGKDDFIAVRQIGSADWALVRYGESQSQSFMLGQAGHIIVTGDFNGDGYADFIRYVRGRRSTDMTQFLINPAARRPAALRFGRTSHILVRPDGTVVQPTEGSSSGGSGASGCSSTKEFKDGGGGALWKPVSESKGRPVFLLPGSYFSRVKSISIVSRGGSEVATAIRRPTLLNGGRAHYDVSKKDSELSQYKPLTVRLSLTDSTVECRPVADPTQRID